MTMFYTGIGSRNTPPEVLEVMEYLGEELARLGYTLRSGGANGADSAFERGCDKANGKKEIFLPWRGFNNNPSTLSFISEKAIECARYYHPNYSNLSESVKKLMARNGYQVLGRDMYTPTNFIVCYTPLGTGEGGTGQAIRIAKHSGIPIFDLGMFVFESLYYVAKEILDFAKEPESGRPRFSSILDVNSGIICHQVNCQNVMGAGIAKDIYTKYPIVKEAYQNRCNLYSNQTERSAALYGHYQLVKVSDSLMVANIFSQDKFGNGPKRKIRFTNPDYLINAINTIAEKYPNEYIYVPEKIGCGYGGGNWDEIKPRLDALSSNVIIISSPEIKREHGEIEEPEHEI